MRARLLTGAMVALALCPVAAAAIPGTRTAHDRAAWRAILHWPNACEQDWREVPEPGSGIQVVGTGKSERLVIVDCDLGAYQGNSMLYLTGPAAPKPAGPLVLDVYGDPGDGHPRLARQTVILGVLSFAPATGVLTVLDKFRGVGDCGIYSRYRLDGNRFVLVETRAKTACNGEPPYAGDRWPLLPLPKGG